MGNDLATVPLWSEDKLIFYKSIEYNTNGIVLSGKYYARHFNFGEGWNDMRRLIDELPKEYRQQIEKTDKEFQVERQKGLYYEFMNTVNNYWKSEWTNKNRFIKIITKKICHSIPSKDAKGIECTVGVEIIINGIEVSSSILPYLKLVDADKQFVKRIEEEFANIGKNEYDNYDEYLDEKTKQLLSLDPEELLKSLQTRRMPEKTDKEL